MSENEMASNTNNATEKNDDYYKGIIRRIEAIIQKSSIEGLPFKFVKSGNKWQNDTEKVFQNWANDLYNHKPLKVTVDKILLEYDAACKLLKLKYRDPAGPLANYYMACLWITTGTFLNMLDYLINTKEYCVTMENFGGQGPTVGQEPTEKDLKHDSALLKSLTDNFAPAWHYCHNNWYRFDKSRDSMIKTALDAAYIKDKIKAIKNKREIVESALKK